MRAFLIASLIALPLALPASAAAAGGATLKGKVKVAGAGCRGVKLIPRTAESEREIAAMFGTTEPTSRTVKSLPYERISVSKADSLGRDARCLHWTQGYRFSNVAPGDYFVTALATGATRDGGGGFFTEGGASFLGREPKRINVYLMRTLSVSASDRTVQLNITQD